MIKYLTLQQLLDFALITGRYLRESPITAVTLPELRGRLEGAMFVGNAAFP